MKKLTALLLSAILLVAALAGCSSSPSSTPAADSDTDKTIVVGASSTPHAEILEQVKDTLADEGYDANFGARPLRRTIQRSVEDALSEEIIAGKIALGDRVELYVEDGNRIAFRKLLPEKPAQPTPTLEA